MPSKREARLQAIREIAEREGWPEIGESAWQRLRAAFPGVSESTLRHDLRKIAIPVDVLIEGVRLDSMDDLERTLRRLAEIYVEAVAANPRNAMNAARKAVLAARRKAETVLRNPRVDPAKREAMQEKFLWLRTWLENPALFSAWAPLRREELGNQTPSL